MNIIWENITESVNADNTLAGFPASFMLNPHSKKRWRAGSQTATLTINLASGCNALCLYNLIADQAVVTVDANDPVMFDLLHDDGWGAYRDPGLFHTYTAIAGTHIATIVLITTLSEVSCGVVYSGKNTEWTTPQWGADTGADSHSIVYDLDNGFEYVFQRNLSEIPQFSLKTKSQAEFFNFKRLAQAAYPNPIIMHLDALQKDMIHYARMRAIPKTQLTSFNNYNISFGLKEFL